jgi:hypothetical protein
VIDLITSFNLRILSTSSSILQVSRLIVDSIFDLNFEIELNRRFNFRNRIENRFDFNYFEIKLNQIKSIFDSKIKIESNRQECQEY